MRIHDSSNSKDPVPAATPPPGTDSSLRDRVIHAIRQVYDPEIPLNIYELGLIYDIALDEAAGHAKVKMTLTTPNCPEAQSLPQHVRQMVERVPGIRQVEVEIVWDPPWNKEMMTEEAKLQLGFV